MELSFFVRSPHPQQAWTAPETCGARGLGGNSRCLRHWWGSECVTELFCFLFSLFSCLQLDFCLLSNYIGEEAVAYWENGNAAVTWGLRSDNQIELIITWSLPEWDRGLTLFSWPANPASALCSELGRTQIHFIGTLCFLKIKLLN